MASLFIPKFYQFHADDGQPLEGGKLRWTLTTTNDPKNTFPTEADALALTNPNPNPVILDADGRVPNEVWLSGRYRLRVYTAADVLISDDDPIEDVASGASLQGNTQDFGGNNTGTANALVFALSPAITNYANGAVYRGRIISDNTAAVTANWGGGVKSVVDRNSRALVAGDLQGPDIISVVYDGVNDVFRLLTADAKLNRTNDTADGLNITPAAAPAQNAVGYLIEPQVSVSADKTFAMTDIGKQQYHPAADTTARTWTIPPNVDVSLPIGTRIPVVNDGASLTIARGAGVSLRVSNLSTDSNQTVLQYEEATLRKVGTNAWVLTGLKDYAQVGQLTILNEGSKPFTFPTGFRDFVLVGEDFLPATDGANLLFRVQVLGVTQSGANDYSNQFFRYFVGTFDVQGGDSAAHQFLATDVSNVETEGACSFTLEMRNVFGTVQRKQWNGESVKARDVTANAAGGGCIGGFFKGSDAALTGFEVLFNTGNMVKGNLRIYGRRG